jgi:hypothetical protein
MTIVSTDEDYAAEAVRVLTAAARQTYHTPSGEVRRFAHELAPLLRAQRPRRCTHPTSLHRAGEARPGYQFR